MGMLIICPLMHCCKKYFATAIAPALCLICYGNVMKISASLGSVHDWVGPLQTGSLRAIGGLCLGSLCCYLVKLVPSHRLTKLGDALVSFLQLGLLAFILYLMSSTYGFTDIVQVVLFSILIIVSFAEETTVKRIFNGEIFFALGKFSMIIFVTQCVAYKCPSMLFYPESWPWRYRMYIFYVLLFSLLNYLIVENIKRRCVFHNIKRFLWKADK